MEIDRVGRENIKRAQLAELGKHGQTAGSGYLAMVRVCGTWQPVGMRVWDTAHEAVQYARGNHTELDDIDIRACYLHPGNYRCHCVLTRDEPLPRCGRCGGTGYV